MPSKRPQYRNDRPHTHFLSKLKNYIATKETFENEIYEELAKKFLIEKLNFDDFHNLQEKLQLENVDFKPRSFIENIEE
jgi:hypothetical protein